MDNTYLLSMKSHLLEIEADLNGLNNILLERALSRYEAKASERLIQTLVEACIGIAKHRCKQLSYPAPENAYTAFERLAEADTDSTNTINWKQIIGMRNALVHDYLNINPEVIETLIRDQQYLPLVKFALDGLVKLGE